MIKSTPKDTKLNGNLSDNLNSLQRPGLQISQARPGSEEGVDPLSLDDVSEVNPDYSGLTFIFPGSKGHEDY